ncbi:Putative esterase [Raoultella terrigena]|uniref:Esterase n=1 Tax=Raoultella terrigena TaxID=577 RepID=A0A7Z8ZCB1_RAOTE|nr:Putative esterase [Raoultella terrigena]
MQNPSTPLVKTRQGTLSGIAEQGIHIWRGIPFAAPPVGELRWRAPRPPARWQGVRRADAFSAASWQDIEYCRELGAAIPGASRKTASISTSGHQPPAPSRCR